MFFNGCFIVVQNLQPTIKHGSDAVFYSRYFIYILLFSFFYSRSFIFVLLFPFFYPRSFIFVLLFSFFNFRSFIFILLFPFFYSRSFIHLLLSSFFYFGFAETFNLHVLCCYTEHLNCIVFLSVVSERLFILYCTENSNDKLFRYCTENSNGKLFVFTPRSQTVNCLLKNEKII